jgi:hypothetical protein
MMDQEKISKLYSELRRESISTGSYPITVRHLESMIRMAESSAKMHLREYVRSDDIDLAIQVMVGSFVSAQKSSIKKQLQKGFRCVLFFLRCGAVADAVARTANTSGSLRTTTKSSRSCSATSSRTASATLPSRMARSPRLSPSPLKTCRARCVSPCSSPFHR